MEQGKTATVVVVGDVVNDHHLYEGNRQKPAQLGRRGTRSFDASGGAAGLGDLLRIVLGPKSVVYVPEVQNARAETHALWKPVSIRAGSETEVWRGRLLGYGEEESARATQPLASAPLDVDVTVIDDADLGFRNLRDADEGIGRSRWALLKTTAPLARGALWRRLVTAEGGERLIVLVSADDLRLGRSTISKGASWDRTVGDINRALREDPDLVALRTCRHLILTFSSDGALWIDGPGRDDAVAWLVCDAAGVEGDWARNREGDVTGFLSVMAASLAAYLVRSVEAPPESGFDLAQAIMSGLHAMRDLAELGHGLVSEEPEPKGFPSARMASILRSDGQPYLDALKRWKDLSPFAKVAIAWTNKALLTEGWSILEASQVATQSMAAPSLLGLARLVMLHGTKEALRDLPHAVFKQLTAIDRREIEGLRRMRSLMQQFEADPKPPRPLCIGVFGPPGAGKSFGVKQLASEIFGKAAWLEFNLSQFTTSSDLLGPFHQARDLVLAGVTPVVFWDEFDSKDLFWLQYLIAPMQDGKFQDDQLTHAVGKAVFVFAGGTRHTFGEFADRPEDEKSDFKSKKGPDFVSRLDTYFDVTGPNPRKPDAISCDLSYPIRRALIARYVLAGDSDRRLIVDSDLLNALLLVPEYKHGSRSLEKLTKELKGRGEGPIGRAGIPAPRDLRMHVDDKIFFAILNLNAGFRMHEAIEKHARTIHADYLNHKKKLGEEPAEDIGLDFDLLETSYQEENRAAARRTADVLALVGMGIAEKETVTPVVDAADYTRHIKHHMERLAEAEHDGWMNERLANGWAEGDKDYARRRHDGLRHYAKLKPAYKENDKAMVTSYEKRIGDDFSVVWLADQVRELVRDREADKAPPAPIGDA